MQGPKSGSDASSIRRLLLVEDDELLSQVLAASLAEEGYAVECARDGKEALRRFFDSSPDLVILDIQLPEISGLEVLGRLRKQTRVPVILLTSRAEEIDRVTGLDLGADDYITKPFSSRELFARIRAIARRLELGIGIGDVPPKSPASPTSEAAALLNAEPVHAGDLHLDPARFEARFRDQKVSLTRSEFQLLLALCQRRGRVLSRDQLLELLIPP